MQKSHNFDTLAAAGTRVYEAYEADDRAEQDAAGEDYEAERETLKMQVVNALKESFPQRDSHNIDYIAENYLARFETLGQREPLAFEAPDGKINFDFSRVRA